MRAWLVAAALGAAVSASGARASCDPELERTVVTPDEIHARGGPGVVFEPGEVLEVPFDARVVCPDSGARSPCVVEGPIRARCAAFRAGIALDDVAVRGAIDLRDAEVAGGLSLADGSSSSSDLSGVHVEGGVTLEGWRLDELAIRDATIAGDVRLTRVTSAGSVSLSGTSVGGDVALVDLSAAEIDLSLDSVFGSSAARVTARGSLFADRVDVATDAVFETVSVGGDLELIGVSIEGSLRLEGVTTGAGVTIKGRLAQRLAIHGLRAAGDLDVFDSEIGAFEIRWSEIGGDLLVDRSTVERGVFVDGVEIAGDLDAERSALPGTLEILRSRFGGLVFVSEEVRAREPRIVDCVPANPLAPPAR